MQPLLAADFTPGGATVPSADTCPSPATPGIFPRSARTMARLRLRLLAAPLTAGFLAASHLAAQSAGVAPSALPADTAAPASPSGSMAIDFGPNVSVFDANTPAAQIQATLDRVFKAQETNQFGSQRNALLFKPGTYAVDANIGFYTQIAGLGFLPDDVTITDTSTPRPTGSTTTAPATSGVTRRT